MSVLTVTSVVAAALGLLVVAALLAAVETVVVRINVVRAMRLREEHEESPRRADALLWLTEHRVRALDALLVATVATRVTLTTLVAVVAIGASGRLLAAVPAALVTIVASLLIAEVVPRTVVLRHLEAAGLLLGRPGRAVVWLLGPLTRLSVVAGRALVPRRHEVSGPHAGDDELRESDAVEEDEDDELEPEERAMIRSIFELADTTVREIMVPRPDMVGVPTDATIDEVIAVAVDGGYSRLPVYDALDTDRVLGVVFAKDLLRRVAAEPNGDDWRDLIRMTAFVPETKRSGELLRELQSDAVHLAIVVDEYGAVVGLVTIEDILEEIVGEIVDEHDQEEVLVEPLPDGRLRIDARLGVDDLNDLVGSDLPQEGWDTVAGLVFGTLGRVPVAGERVELDGTTFEVARLQGRRIAEVVVWPPGVYAPATAGTADHGE